jgi:tetratricopeptide (TPR) repeat protein
MFSKAIYKETLLAALLTGLLALVWAPALLAQEAQYTQAEYNAYMKAVEEGEDSIIEYITANPDSPLTQFAVGAYLKLLQGYVDGGDHAATVTAGEKYLNTVDGEKFEVLYLTTWSAFYSQQYEKAAKYGEKVYQTNPDAPQLVPILARSFMNSGNVEKSIPFAEKLCADAAPKDCYDLLPALTRHFVEKDDQKAADYASKTIEAFDTVERPQGASEEEWDKYVSGEKSDSHAILGRHEYEGKRYSSAEKNYDQARRLSPENRVRRGESYYYIGMSRWQRDLIDAAMESFARGSKVTGTPFTDPCREKLEQLYKATHNGSLAGLDEYISRVGG